MSSVESRIADLTKCSFKFSSPASTSHAPAVAGGNAGPPSSHSAMAQCQGFFQSPPTFDGTTSWSVFLRQFESAAALSALPERHKARILVTASFSCHRIVGAPASIRLYGLREPPLAGCPNSTADFIATQAFIDAINDIDVLRFVRVARQSTFHAALALALEAHILERSTAVRRTRSLPRPQTPANQVNCLDRYRQRSSLMRCYQCNEIGHCSRGCERRPHRPTTPRAAEGRTPRKPSSPSPVTSAVFRYAYSASATRGPTE
ncbi:hypothetical protein HPB50_009558 [Hyalomma asiaticum]|uniref:Uncharacterized protein n=1 Tax=Hyalomma asiaticum TaxID=266040 RepID=A0ACB7THQ4_HYAAI|nr:hypothetical protein HPB50_009558 [Hyalomma asiaticum]